MIASRIFLIFEALGLVQQGIKWVRVNGKPHMNTIVNLPDKVKGLLDDKSLVIVNPPRLPMIVEPKSHFHNQKGGYLSNDVYYSKDLLINKFNLRDQSTIDPINNLMYSTVNAIAKTPYKINEKVFDFLILHGLNLNILIDDSVFKELKGVDVKLTPSVMERHKSKLSKKHMQDHILSIARTFAKHDSIYFPVRLDYRGRLYCLPDYFNYQTTDLAKSLLLFSKPGIINRANVSHSIYFLKVFGANCYGSGLDKKSFEKRVKWVNDNMNEILNYNNLNLIRKSKSKELFIAFCVEFKRYMDFLNDGTKTEF